MSEHVPSNADMAGEFQRELEALINRYSRENGSDTPDFILALYLADCLVTFDKAVRCREGWYGRGPKLATPPEDSPAPRPPGES